MTGHRKWSTIRNPVMDEPVHRHLRDELRHANDLALEVARMREQHTAKAVQTSPAADGVVRASELPLHETEYLTALRESIEALGGRLDIIAVFADQHIALVPVSCADDETAGERL